VCTHVTRDSSPVSRHRRRRRRYCFFVRRYTRFRVFESGGGRARIFIIRCVPEARLWYTPIYLYIATAACVKVSAQKRQTKRVFRSISAILLHKNVTKT